jgi:SP family xylose:H+ symportor-like MFS transporter
LILSAILFTISAIGSAVPEYLNLFGVQTLTSFIIYRIVGGIGVGIASMISPMYIAEIAPPKIRGKAGILESICHHLRHVGHILCELFYRQIG